MNATFTVFTGPMFGGKTSSLLMAVERFKHQNKRVIAFKPKVDARYSVHEIVTHGGWKLPATLVQHGTDIIKLLSESEETYQVIVVDEMFMIPGVSDVLIWMYQQGLTIVASTLDLSSTCKPFEEVVKILPWATTIVKCTAVCTVCGADAHYTHRKMENDDEICIGGSELYEPRCRGHHPFFIAK